MATGLDDNGDTNQDSTLDDVDFAQSLDAFQGDVNACSIIDVTYNSEEDKPDFVPFESTNFDDKFDSTEKSVTERIYSAFGQEPWYLIRTGKPVGVVPPCRRHTNTTIPMLRKKDVPFPEN